MARNNKYHNAPAKAKQPTLSFSPTDNEHLDIAIPETWLWDAACAIWGATDAPNCKDFSLPLIFYKRLSDVFDDEFATHVAMYGDEQTTARSSRPTTPMPCKRQAMLRNLKVKG